MHANFPHYPLNVPHPVCLCTCCCRFQTESEALFPLSFQASMPSSPRGPLQGPWPEGFTPPFVHLSQHTAHCVVIIQLYVCPLAVLGGLFNQPGSKGFHSAPGPGLGSDRTHSGLGKTVALTNPVECCRSGHTVLGKPWAKMGWWQVQQVAGGISQAEGRAEAKSQALWGVWGRRLGRHRVLGAKPAC